MKISIRKSEGNDIPELTILIQRYMDLSVLRPCITRQQLENHVKKLVDSDSLGCQLAAINDNRIVGFATLYYSFSTMNLKRVIIMNDLFVDSNYRGLSIGRQLIEACIKFGEKNNCSSIVWETHKDNKAAQNLYDNFGKRTDSWIHYEKSYT